MPSHELHRVTVLDSRTAKPIGTRALRKWSSQQDTVISYSNEEPESHEGVPKHSPESRAAHPELRPKALLLLMLSILAVVVIAAVVVSIIWSIAAGALVLVFGSGLLFVGNPEVWATTERARERTADEQ